MILGFTVCWCSRLILCNTFSNTVETKIQHNTRITCNCLASKKTITTPPTKILFGQDFANCRKILIMAPFLRPLSLLGIS